MRIARIFLDQGFQQFEAGLQLVGGAVKLALAEKLDGARLSAEDMGLEAPVALLPLRRMRRLALIDLEENMGRHPARKRVLATR